ncbi:MAG: HEAT repeat domain-containing protein, partial [Planctomycetota bacterium]|nr:HEAT repeat domain-containing protein [Planctomycetota bacterium]
VALYTGTQREEKPEEMKISKKKAYYESVSTRSLVGGTADGSEIMAYPKGGTTATFMISEGYNNLVEQNETIEIVGEGFGTGTQVRTKTVFRFLNARIDKERKELSAADMSRTLAGLQKSGMQGGAAETEYLENQKIARLEKEAEGHTVDEILATLRHLIESGQANSEEAYNAVMILSALLALDDTAVEKIQDLIQNDSNIALLEMVTSALGNAGTPAAQKVLVETIGDGKINLQVRTSALISFAPPMTPSPEAEEAMKGMVDPSDKDNLGTNSLFILGVMANRLGTTDPGRAAELVHHILDQEEAFKEADQTHFFLGALENSGHPAAYDKIVPYLDHSDTQTRVDAVSALGRMPQPEATTHLVQAMGDQSPEVRVAAILAASNRSSGSELKAGVKNALLSDPSKEVRQEALNYFAGSLESDPSVAPLLQQVASSDPDPEIQQAAREALTPQ